uniref:Uncharacterized protein n=1 Tax=Romanomermis culicivorax TaxID=13658 RepID=A0A915IMC3_ROMCU
MLRDSQYGRDSSVADDVDGVIIGAKKILESGVLKIDGEPLESGIAVFFFLEPLEQFVVSRNDNLLAIDVVGVHSETVNKSEAFVLHCIVSSSSVSKNVAVVGDDPLIFAVFLVQYHTNGSCTGIGLDVAIVLSIEEEK